QRLVADDAVHHRASFPLGQAVEHETGDIRRPSPGRLELRPKRHQPQHTESSYPIYGSTKGFDTGGISPMRIFENHQQRIGARQPLRLCRQGIQRFLTALLRCQIEGRIPTVVWYRQQFSEKRAILLWGRSLSQQGIELVELHLRRVVTREAS